MAVETLQTMSLVAFIAAGILFLIAVACFFLFNIPKIIGEVTGSTARKAIENIRKQNEQSGNKAYRPSPVNAARGKITDRITPSGNLEKRADNQGISVGTAKLSAENDQLATTETTILNASEQEYDRTETTILNNVTVEYEIGFAGSSEIIE